MNRDILKAILIICFFGIFAFVTCIFLSREMAGFGTAVATLIVSAVVMNQLVGPVLWKHALEASGETETTEAAPASGFRSVDRAKN